MDKYLEANIVFSMFCKNYEELRKDLPIRPSEMGVINIITQREGLFTPLMIAELLHVSKPMVTAHINVLEKKGYIYKEVSKGDKRSFFVRPTEKAEELAKDVGAKMRERLSRIEDALGDEKYSELLSLIGEVNDLLKG